jgi:hypothetical protein
MDDNAKLWAARIGVYTLSSVAMTTLIKAVSSPGHAVSWYILTILFTAGTVYAIMLQMRYKALKLSGGGGKTQAQIEVEALAAYAALQAPTTTPQTPAPTPRPVQPSPSSQVQSPQPPPQQPPTPPTSTPPSLNQ